MVITVKKLFVDMWDWLFPPLPNDREADDELLEYILWRDMVDKGEHDQ